MKRLALCGFVVAWASCFSWVVAAEPMFVGILAIAAEEEVASRLELTDQQREELDELIEARETAALELAAAVRELPAAEQQAKLAPFRQESEELGLAILTPEQRAELEQIRAAREATDTPAAELTQPAAPPEVSDEPEADEPAPAVEEAAPLAAEMPAPASQPAAPPAITAPVVREATPPAAAPQTTTPPAAAPQTTTPPAAAPHTSTPPAAVQTVTPEDVAPQTTTPRTAAPQAATPQTMAPRTTTPQAAAQQPAVQPAAGQQPPASQTMSRMAETTAGEEARLRFNFRFQPWKDVLEWFAEQADLSLVMDAPPPGTFNYQDARAYTPAEAIDLLNSVLLTKGYTLVRRERMLMLVNIEDGIPANLVPTVPLEELEEKGNFELVSTVFRLNRLTPEEAEQEVRKLLGPQGSVISLPKANQLLVTDTAGRLRTIHRILQAVEDPEGLEGDQLQVFEFRFAEPQSALTVIRPLLNIPEDANATSDGSLRLALDGTGRRLLASGKPEMLRRLEQVIKTLDVPAGSGGALSEALQLEVYSVSAANPESVLKVMQTLLAGQPGVRLATDSKTGNLIALARPTDHATIRATLDQMQRDARNVEVIRLNRLDPQLALASVSRLFTGEGDAAANAPKVEADVVNRQLLVRGSEAQIRQIRDLLEKMGDSPTPGELADSGRTLRTIPLAGRSAQEVLEQIELLWPSVRQNKIRMVTPSSIIPNLRSNETQGGVNGLELDERFPSSTSVPQGRPAQPAYQGVPSRGPLQQRPAEDETTHTAPAARMILTQLSQPAPQQSAEQEPPQPAQSAAPRVPERGAEERPPIIVSVGPGGITIASEDTAALDEFESLLTTLTQQNNRGGLEYTVFYLKYAQAPLVADLLGRLVAGGLSRDRANELLSGAGLLSLNTPQPAASAAPNANNDNGVRTATTSSGSVLIVPDARLNALIVQATPHDMDMIEEFLRVFDQQSSPEEVELTAKPRIIPVEHTSAEQIAVVVRQVFQEQMAGGSGRPTNPEELIRMLRQAGGQGGGGRGGRGGRGGGGGGGQGGGGQQAAQPDPQRMSVGVDVRTNSLIVSAPNGLFEQVEALVKELDQPASTTQSISVVPLKRADPTAVQQALAALTNGNIQSNSSVNPAGGVNAPSASNNNRGGNNRQQWNRSNNRGGGNWNRRGR